MTLGPGTTLGPYDIQSAINWFEELQARVPTS